MAVTTMVCSNWALRLPSAVVHVHPSGQVTSRQPPALTMGSMVNTCPSRMMPTACTCRAAWSIARSQAALQVTSPSAARAHQGAVRAAPGLCTLRLRRRHLVAAVVGDVGRAVEVAADAVPAEGTHDAEALGRAVRADGVPQLPEARAGLADGDRLLQGLREHGACVRASRWGATFFQGLAGAKRAAPGQLPAWKHARCRSGSPTCTGRASRQAMHDLHRACSPHLERGLDQALGVLVRVAHDVGLVQVRVEAVQVQGHVHVDDVAMLQRALVWHAMADHLQGGGLSPGRWRLTSPAAQGLSSRRGPGSSMQMSKGWLDGRRASLTEVHTDLGKLW